MTVSRETLAMAQGCHSEQQRIYSGMNPLPANVSTFEKHKREYWLELDTSQIRFLQFEPPPGVDRADMLIGFGTQG
jgi:hypothetical protein